GGLTQHLKSFARKDTVSKQATDFTAAVSYALRLLDYRVAEQGVVISNNVPQHPVYVLGNAVRLEQVVVNLVSNALDAMREQSRQELSIDLRRYSESAVLRVADSGRGIPPEQLSSVFDPFYTTKDVGQGLGLGLSISYGIIRDMGGQISVDSVLDQGTTFRIVLPLAQQRPPTRVGKSS